MSHETALTTTVRDEGFAFTSGAWLRAELDDTRDFDAFAASFEDMPLDEHMADAGRYRRRRYGVFEAAEGGPVRRAPHEAHYQAMTYNRLNGGIDRWFSPIAPSVGDGPTVQSLLAFARRLFESLRGGGAAWHIEVHQFRIEARADTPGKPTPEGVHRDGVDYAMVVMVDRKNIVRGTTTVHRPTGEEIGSFTLTEPFDAAIVDDRRVFHGVTPVEPRDPSLPAHRDVLVVTFRAPSVPETTSET